MEAVSEQVDGVCQGEIDNDLFSMAGRRKRQFIAKGLGYQVTECSLSPGAIDDHNSLLKVGSH